MQTVKEYIETLPNNIENTTLINNGISIGTFTPAEAVEKYGDWCYINTHSQTDNSVMLLIKNF